MALLTHNFKPTVILSNGSLDQSFSASSTLSRPKWLHINNLQYWFGKTHYSQILSSRRLLIPSASGIWDAITGGDSARKAIAAIRRGMLLFREGDVLGSLSEFDKAIELDPRQKAYLWQRGLSLYYANRFQEGSEQFRFDVAQNPNDTEESIWCFLCEAQLYGAGEARRKFLEVGRDPRSVMRNAYNMFKDGGDPEKLVAEFSSGRDHEYFYASLYAGLYYESEISWRRGGTQTGRISSVLCNVWVLSTQEIIKTANRKPDEAKVHILAASQSPYGLRSDDYMASLAKVHCQCRNWNFS